MKPYYSHAGIEIYLGDCREIIPSLPKVDLVLTDPPYGIGRDGMQLSTSSHGGRKPYEFMGWDKEIPSKAIFDLMFSKSLYQCIWGANYFTQYLPPSMGWLVWDKGQDICSSDCELAFTNRNAALRRKVLNRMELKKDGTNHPTQKPLSLICWCISFWPDAVSIMDPYMGSGTTLRAAKDLGRRAIGIDIEERYCEIAARRLEQETLPLSMPVEQPKQEAFL